MDDRERTLALAAVAGVRVTEAELAPLFDLDPELVEWSVNSGPDPRGTLRVSTWTSDPGKGARAFGRLAPALRELRACLLGDDHEGLGLALHADAPAHLRWWALGDDGAAMAARIRDAWPDQAHALTELLAAAGGPGTCAAVGIEAADGAVQRRTYYARLRDPASAIRVLEHARVTVSRATNLFWKGICGLEPGGRIWPKVWAGRSLGASGGWKFYYFARGDDLRRTDEVLLDAIVASPDLLESWKVLRREAPDRPFVQLIGLTVPDGGAPRFTAYLARS